MSTRILGAVGSVSHACGNVSTEVAVLRADDRLALASTFSDRPTVPTGTELKAGRSDIDAVPAQAARSGADFLLMVQVTEQYLIKPR